MVTNVTSFTGNGLKDWLIQRVSALYFAVYTLGLLLFILLHPHLQAIEWQTLFHASWFKLATLLALVMVSLHTWIGVWTVTTDYVKCTGVRLSLQIFVMLWLVAQFFWGLMIMWGQ